MTKAGIAAILVVAAFGLAVCLHYVPHQADDAYIAYRYAANLSQGSGLAYNPGEAPTEGFTSPLWTLGLALAAVFLGGPAIPWVATIAGLLCYLGVILLLAWPPARGGGVSGRTFPAAACAFAVLPTATAYAGTGLESLLFVLVVAGIASALAGRARGPVAWALAFAALLVRPEAAWMPVAAAAQLLATPSKDRPPLGRLRALAIAFVVGGAALAAYRLAIFGDLLPNTYYAKSPDLAAGLGYVAGLAAWPPVAVLLAGAVIGAVLGGGRYLGFLAAEGAWMLAAILEGGDWMPAGRFLLPALVLMAMACGGLVDPRAPGRRVNAVGASILAAVLVTNGAYAVKLASVSGNELEARSAEVDVVADWIEESGARSVGLVDIGYIGFETGAEIVDLAGLTDRVIGRASGAHLAKEIDPGYVLDERAPDLLLVRLSSIPKIVPDGTSRPLSAVTDAHAMSPIEARIMRDPRFREEYRPLFLLLPPPGEVHPSLYGRLVLGRKGFEPAGEAAKVRGIVALQPPPA